MLKYIEVQKCPHCSAPTTVERLSENTHVNGHKWETRSFACGLSVEHVPNFIDRKGKYERFTGECTRSEEFKKRGQIRKDTAEKIRTLIQPLKYTDPQFVDLIERELKYLAGD